MSPTTHLSRRELAALRLAAAFSLLASLAWAIAASWHWPLVGDAALMHYIVLALSHGAAPYRSLVDINYPGTYASEALAMHLFGDGARGLRLYDLSALAVALAACLAIAGRTRWFGGLLGGGLFALVHLQDGLAQQAQRDLLLATLLLCALAAFRQVDLDADAWPAAFACGLLFGFGLTVKPVLLPLALAPPFFSPRLRQPRVLLAAFAGLLVPLLAAAVWLQHFHALSAFLASVRVLGAQHAALGRRSLPFLLTHAAAPVAPLGVLSLLLFLLTDRRRAPGWPRWLLLLGGTLLAYLVQGKALPYQRYPFLAVLLLGCGLLWDDRLREGSAPTHRFALFLVLGVCFVLAPLYAFKTARLRPATPFQDALAAALLRTGSAASLNHQVQCLDTYAGCINTLYDLRLEQSTGFLYDCYLFNGNPRVQADYRNRFWQAFQRSPPRVLVLTSRRCFGSLQDAYSRIEEWPELADELGSKYQRVSHWTPTQAEGWSSRSVVPAGFELFVRRAKP